MTKVIFQSWFENDYIPSVQEHLRKLNLPLKEILFLDNASVHCDELTSKDGIIKAIFLPANTTAILQPMDQSVISSFKQRYKNKFLKSIIIDASQEHQSLLEQIKSFNLKQCIIIISEVWNTIPRSIFVNSWHKMKINLELSIEQEISIETIFDEIFKEELSLNHSELEEYYNVDSAEKGYEFMDDNQIVTHVAKEGTDESSSEELEPETTSESILEMRMRLN